MHPDIRISAVSDVKVREEKEQDSGMLGMHNEEENLDDTFSEADSMLMDEDLGDLEDLDLNAPEMIKKVSYKFNRELEVIPEEQHFKPKKNDELDRAIGKALENIHITIPFIRIKKEKYLIGSTARSARITN